MIVDALSDTNRTPLEHLYALAECSLGPQAICSSTGVDSGWKGYTLRVGRWNLVFPHSETIEIVSDADIQPIPWAVHWVRGVTNLRGEIHSVVDLSDFLGLGAVAPHLRGVLLKLPDRQLKSALLLDKWVNLRTFPGDLKVTEAPEIPSVLRPSVKEILAENEQKWVVLDPERFCHLPEFVSITNRTPVH